MASFNHCVLIGNLTRDPELRFIPSGTAVCDVGLAVNTRVKKNDQWVDECDFFDIVCWGKTAEIVNQYLKKGSSALFSGRLKLDQWQTEDGQKRSKVKIICEKMQMLGSKGDGGGGGGQQQQPQQQQAQSGYSGQNNQYSQAAPPQQQQTAAAQAPTSTPEDEIPF